jgi:hypothetical protein
MHPEALPLLKRHGALLAVTALLILAAPLSNEAQPPRPLPRSLFSPEQAVELFNPNSTLPPVEEVEQTLEAEESEEEVCECAQTDLPEPALIPVIASLRTKKNGSTPTVPTVPNASDSPPKVVAVSKMSAREGSDKRKFKVLVLGDSLGLCGFGKSLDARLRTHKNISAVATYMACGTIPSSWLKIGPYSGARTACGFWSIESASGNAPSETRDTYGMARGHKPGSHLIPKIENLLESFQPDILVMQNGTNLLSLFSDGSTVIPARHDVQLRAQLTPFLQTVTSRSESLKKIYWVAPPTSGRYSKATQDFLVEKISSYGSGAWGVLDSRQLVSYPYKTPMPDKEHFIGRDMDTWAEGVFKTIIADIDADAIPRKSVAEQRRLSAPGKAAETAQQAAKRSRIEVRAKLVRKSAPLLQEQILPYQESVVSHLYEIESVLDGSYGEKELLVMHPAHIRLQPQTLSQYKVGQSYQMTLTELDGSPWESIKRSDSSGKLELLPFIRVEDEARYPSANR